LAFAFAADLNSFFLLFFVLVVVCFSLLIQKVR
jgi:hypothetical protein